MKTILINIPEKDENFFMTLLKKFGLKARVVSAEDLEEKALADWIKKGMESEDIPEEEISVLFKKHGIEI